jgi:ribosomal protein L11 methyltransferase
MSWQEINIAVPYEYVEPISYLFSRYGHGLTMELDSAGQVLFRTYLPNTSQRRLARIEVGVRLVNLLHPLGELTVRPIPQDEDWQNAWKAHFFLLKVGQHLVIRPSWIPYVAAAQDVVIDIDPGMAFGTGYHPTTYTCLEALELLLRSGMEVLDLGTGSGILTIAAVKLGAAHVVALDIDPEAVRAARQNLRRCGIAHQVSLAEGTVPHRLVGPGRFDLAVANISARVVPERAPYILPALKPGALFIASGIMGGQQPQVCDALREAGFSVSQVLARDEWVSLVCRREPVS